MATGAHFIRCKVSVSRVGSNLETETVERRFVLQNTETLGQHLRVRARGVVVVVAAKNRTIRASGEPCCGIVTAIGRMGALTMIARRNTQERVFGLYAVATKQVNQ